MKFENPSLQPEQPEISPAKSRSGALGKLGQKLKTALAFAGLAGTLTSGEMQAAETLKPTKSKSPDAVPVKVLEKPSTDTNAPVYSYEQKTWNPKTPEEEQARQEAIKRLLNESSAQAESLRKEVVPNGQDASGERSQKSPQTTQGGTFNSSFIQKRGTNSEGTSYRNYGGNQDRGTTGTFNSNRRRR